MRPPDRLAGATLATYRAATPGQEHALRAVRRFVGDLRQARRAPLRRLKRHVGLRVRPPRRGLYLVGPVGTGKTHLLAAAWHALTPAVPCAFLHSSALFRMQERPARFARRLAERYHVLCLDEVEIDDAANEARLVAVLRTLEAEGVVLLATSNVTPGGFLSGAVGGGRFQRFLTDTFEHRHEVVRVGGEDYRKRLDAPGRAWIGAGACEAMRTAFEHDTSERGTCATCWIAFDALMEAATHTAHDELVRRLLRPAHVYLAGVAIRSTDDALRLLRIIDVLYTDPQAPTLFFCSAAPPEDWFRAEAARAGIERGVAEKFERTVSRLRALCAVPDADAVTDAAASPGR